MLKAFGLVLSLLISMKSFSSDVAKVNSNVMSEKLFAKLMNEGKSFVFSPLSVELALSMTAEGAVGDAQNEFKNILGLPLQNPKSVLSEIKSSTKSSVFNSAQSLWVSRLLPLSAEFTQKIEKDYGSQILPLSTEKEINDWVADKTKNKINDLLLKGSINSQTRLVLVNAVYFKALWQSAFNKNNNVKSTFHTHNKARENSVFMVQDFRAINYFENKILQSAELKYKDADFSFTVFLPKENQKIDGIFFKTILSSDSNSYALEQVHLQIPQFKMTFSKDLVNVFKEIGLKAPFLPTANFSKISSFAVEQKLLISQIAHKAFIEIDEQGTEAAAATAVLQRLGSTLSTEKPKQMVLNRPFVFIIKKNETVLFVGYYNGKTQN